MADRQRDYARSARARAFSDVPGKPLIKAGLVLCGFGPLLGVGSSLLSANINEAAGLTLVPIMVGLPVMARGAIHARRERRIEQLQVPLSARQPWLFAPAPFTQQANGVREFAGPGWQPDPMNPYADRWWDGQSWTADTQTRD